MQEKHMTFFCRRQHDVLVRRIYKKIFFLLDMANLFPSSIFVLEFFYSIATEFISGSFKKEGERKTPLHIYTKAHILPTIYKPSIRYSIIIAESYVHYFSQSLQEPEGLVLISFL